MTWGLPMMGFLILLISTVWSTCYWYKTSKKLKRQIKSRDHKVHFFTSTRFSVCLKGIIDIRGRFTEGFSVVIVMEPHNTSHDKDFTKYNNYFALNINRKSAWFSMKCDGEEVELKSITKIIGNSDLDHGLEPDVVTTYWLSYDRDNMMIKYGKGYAMQETMLMQCDFNLAIKKASEFSPDVNFQKNNTNEKEDVKKQWSKFFNIYDTSREGVEIMVYRSPGDVVRSWEKSVGPGQKAGVIHTERMIKVRKEPLVVNPSPLVMPAASVTMSLIDRNQFLFSSELPLPCKMLYDTIIDCEPLRDKPNLIDAIRWDKFSVVSQYQEFYTYQA